ncbi:MAG: tyrosine--tRNA ligase [Tissierellia bacterium]|nr:tyrosine--tRNA ligase [Tissierellia bacterium]
MNNVFDVLQSRGYIDQVTYEEELREVLGGEPINFYIGFDATADSLTLGHFLQIMVMKRMQQAGHRPVALLGGGTTMIGDPSFKDGMRPIMTKEMIDYNASCFKEQLGRFLDFGEGKAMMVNNGDWLLNLKFMEFMRDIGVHFSVNRMLTFDCYKNRLDKGLTFFEFGYMLMQSYDFLYLYRNHDVVLQLGGSDQWSNMLSGYELVRKLEQGKVYSMTFKLLTTAAGIKMGKTEAGTIWLDEKKTSPYELYQYLRNCDDRDVIKFLKLLNMLSDEEIEAMEKWEGAKLNDAKDVLAFEVFKMVHGEEKAQAARETSKALFAGGSGDDGEMPTTEITAEQLTEMTIVDLLRAGELVASNGEARRLIEQGGIHLNDIKVEDFNRVISAEDFVDGKAVVRKGKKVFHQFTI